MAAGSVVSHCPGAADRYLGQLATALRRWDGAEAHYDRAVVSETGLRAPPLLARTHYWYGAMVIERDLPGDSQRARTLLESALATATMLGMTRLAAQASALLDATTSAGSVSHRRTGRTTR